MPWSNRAFPFSEDQDPEFLDRFCLLTEGANLGLPVCPEVLPHVKRVEKILSIFFMYLAGLL